MKLPLFTGSSVALVTPMHQSGDVNYEMLTALIERQIQSGTSAITICGTTGESATLTDQERISVIAHTVEAVHGRIQVIAGTGSNSTAHSIFLSRKAQEAGVDGLLLVTPYYNKCTSSGLLRHYFSIADSVELPAIVYNIPSRTGVSMSADNYHALSRHPNLNGVKEASGDTDLVLRTLDLCGDDFYIWSGNDSQILPLMSMGCKGVISVLANLCPEAVSQLTNFCLQGDISTATKLQRQYRALIDALFRQVNPVPVKTAMGLMGLDAGPLRLPLCPPEPDETASLAAVLDRYGLLSKARTA